jgi:carbon storage regulator
MLVLGRKVGQRVIIGEGVVVTVVAVRDSQVRLGIEAPGAVTIQREELCSAGVIETTSPVRKRRPSRMQR